MKLLKTLMLAGAALALPAQAIAQTATPCMTAAEAQGLVSFALPDLIGSMSTSCKATLGPNAYLIASGAAMSDRYRGLANSSWPAAKSAFTKLAGKEGAVFATLPDEVTKALITAGIGSELGGKIKPQSCGMISNVLEQLAPLPPQNTSNLIGLLLEAVGSGSKGLGKLSICPRASSTTASK